MQVRASEPCWGACLGRSTHRRGQQPAGGETMPPASRRARFSGRSNDWRGRASVRGRCWLSRLARPRRLPSLRPLLVVSRQRPALVAVGSDVAAVPGVRRQGFSGSGRLAGRQARFRWPIRDLISGTDRRSAATNETGRPRGSTWREDRRSNGSTTRRRQLPSGNRRRAWPSRAAHRGIRRMWRRRGLLAARGRSWSGSTATTIGPLAASCARRVGTPFSASMVVGSARANHRGSDWFRGRDRSFRPAGRGGITRRPRRSGVCRLGSREHSDDHAR